jgi:protoporphyrinogen oxidase
MEEVAVLGAGPAGLTAAFELDRLGMQCRVFEGHHTSVGGLSRTEKFKDYRFDIGGHRFFTKSLEINGLWHDFLPPSDWLSVKRMSRIYYAGRFYSYPLKGAEVVRGLGLRTSMGCLASYAQERAKPGTDPVSFEDWVVAQFGRRLFEIFFKTYTEKVWGIPCEEISADWAAQRIKGLSLPTAVRNALGGQRNGGVKTLIEEFQYPKLGPGMVWDAVADRLRRAGTPIHLGARVTGLHRRGKRITSVCTDQSGLQVMTEAAHVISSIPLRSLIEGLTPEPPESVLAAARGLRYRDFVTVVLVIDEPNLFPDNWIYIHDPQVKVGRIQNFKNWSPLMVPNESTTALGLEYFCFEGDGLWDSSDKQLLELAIREMTSLGMLDPSLVLDGTVVRVPKAYPTYNQSYETNVDVIRSFLDCEIENLELCGRNGMHKYNNQDHAMMTGLLAARNVAGENWDVWRVNEDAEYAEEIRKGDTGGRMIPRRVTDLEPEPEPVQEG